MNRNDLKKDNVFRNRNFRLVFCSLGFTVTAMFLLLSREFKEL